MKKIIIIILILILLGAGGVFLTYNNLIKPVSDNTTEKEIVIPLGSTADDIANILKENNLIKGKTIFKVYAKLNKLSDFRAGTYYLKESMDLKEITEMLQTGIMFDPNEISITYIEGKNIDWLAKTIEERTNNTADDVYALLENEEYIDSLIEKYWFITDVVKEDGIRYALEGYLFPDTYAIANKDITVEEIFEKMLDQMEKVLNKYKEDIEKSQYSVHELLTLASIVELESRHIEDKKTIAGIMYNRLEQNISLGSDVTAYYAAGINMGDRDLYQSEINSDNPYNTRGANMEGKLPIGPIAASAETSIEAVLRPEDTDYLFFVADKNGNIYYTNTNEEHEQLVDDLIDKGLWYEY